MQANGVVTCDRCQTEFKVIPHTVDLADGGQKNYFECPGCHIRFVYAEVTPRGMALFRRIQEIVDARGRQIGDRELEQLTAQLGREIARYTEFPEAIE